MNELTIFRASLVNALHGSLQANLDKYLRDDVWISEVSTKNMRDMQTRVEVPEQFFLDLPEDGDLRDIENAIRLHKALRHLTPLQARDPRLWTRLSHVEFWPYMRIRWPVEKHMADRDRAKRYTEARYFVAQSQSRSLLRHGIARLWWTGQLTYDADREDPYELTAILLSRLDIAQQILERSMGRAANITKGFLEFLLKNEDTLLTGGNVNRVRIRRLAKRLNMFGGVSVLDLLSQGEVMNILSGELARIMDAESERANELAVE